MPKAVYKVTTILSAAWYRFFKTAALVKAASAGACMVWAFRSLQDRTLNTLSICSA